MSGMVFLLISLLAVRNDLFLFWIIPVVLLLLMLAVIAIDRFFLVMVFFIPLSVQLRFIVPEPPADLFLPTELMTILLMLIVLYKIFAAKEYDLSLLKKPVGIVILLLIVWTVVTSLTSTMPLVSVKHLLVKLWFISAFYILALELFRKKGFLEKVLSVYIAGMVPVVIFNIRNLYASGLFNQLAAHSSVRPFFNDHTSFGAVLAFLIPVCIWFVNSSGSGWKRLLYILALLVFIAGIVFSYSRAAWISLITGLGFGLLMILRVPWKLSIPSFIAVIVLLVMIWPSVINRLNTINQTSSGNMAEHLQSVANISTDISNLERINRWKSAVRMTAEKPFFGWGPGTYQFQYAPYQFSYDKTPISTNFGTGGNAHSEYLGYLVETGLPGFVFYLMLIITVLITGLRAWDNIEDIRIRRLVIALLCGVITYVVHGALNNFLDTDKIASLFWMYTAAFITLEMSYGQKEHSSQTAVRHHTYSD